MNKTIMMSIAGALGAGILAAAFYRGIILVRLPMQARTITTQQTPINRKAIMLYFWRNETLKKETVQLVMPASKPDAIMRIANAWLNLLDEEGLLKKRVRVDAVLMVANQTQAYISFDRNPFDKAASTHEKLLFLQGLLKTLSENGITLTGIYFQAHHQPLQDYHLDFSNAWPMSGF